tara:strand:+ start:165 stop:398 length:234 start_codon:yes stop_codon:yes gene_type:complete
MDYKQQQDLNEAIDNILNEGGYSFDLSPLTQELNAVLVNINRIRANDAYKILPTKQMNKIKSIRKELVGLIKEIDKL